MLNQKCLDSDIAKHLVIKKAWDQIVAHDKFLNACVFVIDKNPMLPAMDRIIPWIPAWFASQFLCQL
jgi:hypothetical protein